MYDFKPLDRLNEIGSRFANLVHITPLNGYYFLPMNTRLPPFNNLKARQAVSMALNRRAIVNLGGGPALGTPLCQLLPDGIPGFAPYCPYSRPPGAVWRAPDLAAAKRLVQESGTAGEKVTLITSNTELQRSIGTYVQSVLSDLGYDAALRSLSENIEFSYLQNSNNKVQIGLTYWLQDYPAASDFLNVLLSCGAFHPGSDSSINMAEFCDPAIDKRMQGALALEATDPAAALVAWRQIDHDVTDQAPFVTLYQIHALDIVSARLGHYNFHRLYHTLFSQVWVR